MAKRKSASTAKTAKQQKPDEAAEAIIIEGKAEEVKTTKPKTSPNESASSSAASSKPVSSKPSSSMPRLGVLIALISLGVGIAGYFAITAPWDNTGHDQSQDAAIAVLMETQNEIQANLSALNDRTAPPQDLTPLEDSLEMLGKRLTVVEEKLTALAEQPVAAEPVANDPDLVRHDDLTALKNEVQTLKDALQSIMAPQAQAIEKQQAEAPTIANKSTASEGKPWWQQLWGGFTVTKVDTPKLEGEE